MIEHRILFVCMGNICRSPSAEAVLKTLVARAGVSQCFQIDSAGTHDYHVGEPPDRRAAAAALRRGYSLSGLMGRQIDADDFSRFDLILAMDRDNLALLQSRCPVIHQEKLKLFLDYARNFAERDVPDPYYGGEEGFERVLDMIEDAGEGLIQALTVK